MSKGLEELKRLAYENACCRCQYYIEKKCTNKGECVWKTIEKELKAKDNLVSMCENLAKLVGLKEKDYVELETLITNKLKALATIVQMFDIRVEKNKLCQCFVSSKNNLFAVSQETYNLITEALNGLL